MKKKCFETKTQNKVRRYLELNTSIELNEISWLSVFCLYIAVLAANDREEVGAYMNFSLVS